MRVLTLLLVILIFPACLSRKSQKNSDILLETDDRKTPATDRLIDVEDLINNHVNAVLASVRREQTEREDVLTIEKKAAFLAEVARRLTAPRRGSGVGIGSGPLRIELSILTEIEAWAVETLSAEQNEIAFIPFDQSLYRDNPVGIFQAKVPSHTTQDTANHSIGPVIRVRDHIIGIDKLAHFFEQGYWYYDATRRFELISQKERWEFGAFMEGHPDLKTELRGKYAKLFGYYCPTCVLTGGFGYYGSASTGVISLADMVANEDGYAFYRDLNKNIEYYDFQIGRYNLAQWNEQQNRSIFVPGLIVKP